MKNTGCVSFCLCNNIEALHTHQICTQGQEARLGEGQDELWESRVEELESKLACEQIEVCVCVCINGKTQHVFPLIHINNPKVPNTRNAQHVHMLPLDLHTHKHTNLTSHLHTEWKPVLLS